METLQWHFTNEHGEKEAVALEPWVWGVVYEDGTELHQFDDKGTFHQLREIDQSKVKLWVLYQPRTVGNGRIDIVIPRNEDGTLKEVSLVHKYRNFIFNANTEGERRVRVPVFGYKVKGNQPHYNFVLPSGTIVQSYGDQEPQLSSMGI